MMKHALVTLAVAGLAFCTLTSGQDKPLPPDDQYVVVKDGHLTVGGERIRVWAAIGKLHADSKVSATDTAAEKKAKVAKSRQSTDALLARFTDLGFNGFRLWRGFNALTEYTPGDGSAADDLDYFLAQAGKRGMKVWVAALNSAGQATSADVKILDDPIDADAWSAAVEEVVNKKDKNGKAAGPWDLRNNVARFWDPRLEALALSRMKNVATHLNKHTGLRWCDDPVFGVWELSNEEWWMRKMVSGQWQKLPAFFRNQLVARWNHFLKDKYGDDESLKTAWGGLLAGESLDSGSVLLLPMAGKSSPAASLNDASEVAIKSVQALDQDYERDDFSAARGADVLEFFVGLHVAHKQREHAALKDLGKSTRLSPWIYDTGIGYEIQSQYLHQNADAVAHDAYVNGTGPSLESQLAKADEQTDPHRKALAIQDAERISANTKDGRWVNWLLKPPGISQGVPWLEHNRIEGKPYLAYETQIQQPAKYRADYPLRVAALASIQDWDWICWHYFGGGAEDNAGQDDRHFEKMLDVTTGGHPQGYHFTYDEVQNAMMRAAAFMWRNQALAPAANPTKFIYGSKSLYNPRSMDYAGSYGMSGLDMMYTTYQYGVRVLIDPTREEDEVIGPVVKFEDRNTHNPYTPTEQITFDWKKGYLEMDSSAGVAWTGLLANYGDQVKFDSSDVTLSNVSIDNPAGIYDPVGEDEKYIAFSLYSEDGKSLAQTKKAALSLVSTSFNTGFVLKGHEGNKSQAVRGEAPVLVARVGGTVQSPAISGMRYTFYDWSMQPIGKGVVKDGKLVIPADKEIFVVELER